MCQKDDLISRQAVIDMLKQMRKDGDMVPWEGKDVFARIRKLPSAQPEQRWIPCDKGEPDEDMECWVTVKTTDTLYRGGFYKTLWRTER